MRKQGQSPRKRLALFIYWYWRRCRAAASNESACAAPGGSSDGALDAHHAIATSAALCAKAGASLGLAGLFVELPYTDFLLDAAALDQLPKPPNRLLGSLFVTQSQFDHSSIAFRPRWDGRRLGQLCAERVGGNLLTYHCPIGASRWLGLATRRFWYESRRQAPGRTGHCRGANELAQSAQPAIRR